MIQNHYVALFILFVSTLSHAQEWQWVKGSVGNSIISWSVATDLSGNAFTAGVSKGAVSFDNYDPSSLTENNLCVIAKYNSRGDFLWARSTPNSVNTFLINIATDRTGNCYVLGWLADSIMEIGAVQLRNTAYPNAQYFIAKYDPQGAVLWAKTAGGKSGSLQAPSVILNNKSTARIMGLGAIVSDSNNSIYVATGFDLPSVAVDSYTVINSNSAGGSSDIMLVKYDSSGNVLFVKTAGGQLDDIPCALTVTPTGTIYIAGLFNSDTIIFGPSVIADTSTGFQKWNACIFRYDAAGNPVWAGCSRGSGRTYASGIVSDSYNNVYLVGGTADDSICFDSAKILNPYPANPVLYFVKFDTANSVSFCKTVGSYTGGGAWGYSATVYMNNGIWVCGAFTDKIDIAGHTLDTPKNSVDPVFIANFDLYGNYKGSATLPSGSDRQVGIACDTWGNIFLCADYEYPCIPFIIADDVLANVASGKEWQYLAKYTYPGNPGPGGEDVGPHNIYISDTITICRFDTLSVIAPHGYSLYQWNDGSSDTVLRVTTEGVYWVTGIGYFNSFIVDSVHVIASDALCNCNAILPAAFTPNGDNNNDFYRPIFESGCSISKYAFSIYNRWGQRVFYTEDPYARWDGKFEGVPVDMDVYMYYLKYTPNPNYPERVKKGDITLIR